MSNRTRKVALIIALLSMLAASAFANATVINGTTVAGNQLTITGTGFSATPLLVTFNGQKLTVVSDTASRIVAAMSTIPAPGTYRLVVKAGSGSATAYASVAATPSIVAQVTLTDQTGPIPATVLVTPQSSGVFRLSGIQYGSVGCDSEPPADVAVSWTDLRGPETVQAEFNEQTGSSSPGLSVIVEDIAGAPLSYQIPAGNINCTPYNFFMTVEQLQ
jgi:hypothetical protein